MPLSLPTSWVSYSCPPSRLLRPAIFSYSCPPSRLLHPAIFLVVRRCLVLPTRSAMTRLAFVVCIALALLSLLPMLLLPRLQAVMTQFSFHISHTVLLWFCAMVMLRCLSRALVFLAFPPTPPLLFFALNLPCRLTAAANALLGMVIFYLLHTLISALTCRHPMRAGCYTKSRHHAVDTGSWP
jgi:hypothetical protein